VLTVEPVAVPPSLDNSRKAVRQRLAELENAAMRNYHAAEEALRALAEEHKKLEQELAERSHAQREAAILRRELERISNDEARRAELEKKNAKDEARAAMAEEVKRFQEEHQRVLDEMSQLRGSMSEHDGLLDEYMMRLREEQVARAALRTTATSGGPPSITHLHCARYGDAGGPSVHMPAPSNDLRLDCNCSTIVGQVGRPHMMLPTEVVGEAARGDAVSLPHCSPAKNSSR
jgi:hypothetical protein